jgi:hypothetical protein
MKVAYRAPAENVLPGPFLLKNEESTVTIEEEKNEEPAGQERRS